MKRALAILCLAVACAHARTPEQDAMMKRADCAELLRASDAARAKGTPDVAAQLASACTQDKLDALVAAAEPADGLLWCGRAKASGAQSPSCAAAKLGELSAKLHPRLTLGPPDEGMPLDPLLGAALQELGPELNVGWDADDPDVIVGRLSVAVDHQTSRTTTTVTDAKGGKQRVPAVQHRFIARAEAQVEIADKTRTLRASEEARDYTWDAAPRQAVAAKFEPTVPPEDELKKRAVLSWLRTLGKALAAAPPEAVDVTDARGCVAYGLSLNLAAGDSSTAASGNGDPVKVASCEKLLGEPAGAGIPVP